jgi:hypothetical protein
MLMKSAFPNALLPVLGLLLVLAAAPFLEATPEHLEKKKGVQVRVLAAGVPTGASLPELAVIDPDRKPAPLEFLRFNVSLPVLQKKDSVVRVYLLADLKAQLEGKARGEDLPLPAPVLEYALPPGSGRCMVVVEPGAQGGWTYRGFAEDAQDFPGGSRLFLNLTGARLSGQVGDARFEIPARSSGLVRPSKVGGEALRQNVQVFAATPGRQLPVASTRWTFHPDQRGIVLVYADAQLTRFRLLAIPDNVPGGSLSAR